jgi:hypothetical protein
LDPISRERVACREAIQKLIAKEAVTTGRDMVKGDVFHSVNR